MDEIRDGDPVEAALTESERRLHELGERVKELTALHGTARLLQDDSLTIVDILERVALLLPPAFQYPDVTEARLTFDGMFAATPGFRSSPWSLQTSAETRHGQKLAIEVIYVQRMPQWAEGPFLTEERNLINSIVEMLVVFLDRRQAEQALERAFEEIRALKDRLVDENLALKEEIDRSSMFEEVIGASPRLQAILRLVSQVAPTDSTVLVSGETGTGKELIARAVHKSSLRSGRPFVSVNCAAVPQALIGSELFGHEKGAFTGATQRRLGRFELAQGGTIFLDEVGELPGETQVALLRVLQERAFERVGGNQSIRADVRVIAATNRDLPAAIRAGTFRNDLYYRLNVFPLHIAPLRERKEDIPLLLEYFVDRFGRKLGKRFRDIPRKAVALLESYSWPGNIRELQNVIERSIIVSEEESFSVDERWLAETSLPLRHADAGPLAPTPETDVKEMIEAALTATRGQVSGSAGAAAKLGIPPSTLESKIRSLRIDKSRFRNV
jgi:transcriptional regulator with GAF, ATPase, and Fis domain